ncbi:hypothetical protein SAMN02745823_03774 [Sporobacter termitidis DSM 10068]|uniref:Uncharacterized protein n=1 Tax=Sporobacter termitidis DSM 10068 TaxID=1123282 RepID=A0A1M5ZHS1_9FIRM|nr:hypothetical protein SAMN02745823_03774 [Sporobacter termitidis DSM 10068]
MNAKVIQVIETSSTTGTGKPDDPVRTITQYWRFNGKLLFTADPACESLN